jgi:predicted ferric reductase
MEGTIIQILELLKASPADYFNFALGLLVVAYVIILSKRQKVLDRKYQQLDKLNLVHAYIIADKLKVNTVKIHRSGDYEITNPLNDE